MGFFSGVGFKFYIYFFISLSLAWGGGGVPFFNAPVSKYIKNPKEGMKKKRPHTHPSPPFLPTWSAYSSTTKDERE